MPPYWGYGGYDYSCKPPRPESPHGSCGYATWFLDDTDPRPILTILLFTLTDRAEKSAKATREEAHAKMAFNSYIETWHNGKPPKEDIIHQLLTPNISLTGPCCKSETAAHLLPSSTPNFAFPRHPPDMRDL